MSSKKKILVIEDELMLQQAYAQILGHTGYEVAVASDGEEGLKQLKRFDPDLILLDILMPRVDGLEFLNRAQIKKNYPGLKVLAFSNLSNAPKINEMIELGATRHVLKSSVSPGELVSMVAELLKDK